MLFYQNPTFENRDDMESYEAEFVLRRLTLPKDKEVDAAGEGFAARTMAALGEALAEPILFAEINKAMTRDIARTCYPIRATKKN